MSQTSLQDLIAGCQNERKSYRSDDDSRSPSCAEIFRRAFANDQEAWTAVHELFKPLFTSWGYRFSTVYDLQQEYQEDALQVSWDLFCKNAPKRATSLLVDNTIGRALEYMQTIVRREVLRIARRRPRNEMSIFTNDEHPTLEIEEPLTTEQKAEARIILDTVLTLPFSIALPLD